MRIILSTIFFFSTIVHGQTLLNQVSPLEEFKPDQLNIDLLAAPQGKFEKTQDYELRTRLLKSQLEHRFVSSYELKATYDPDLEQYVFSDQCSEGNGENATNGLVRYLDIGQAKIKLECYTQSFTVPMAIEKAKATDGFINGYVVFSVFPQSLKEDEPFTGSMEEFVVVNRNNGEQLFQRLKAKPKPLDSCEAEVLNNVPKGEAKTPALRNKIYEKLQGVQKAAEAGDIALANELLDDMYDAHSKKKKSLFGSSSELNSYELANYYNMRAFMAYTQKDFLGAIKAYQNLIIQPDLPKKLIVNTTYSTAQLYIITDQPACAIKLLTHWLTMAESPSAHSYALIANQYFELQELTKAKEFMSLGMEKLRNENKEIPKAWLALERDIEYYLRNDEAYSRINEQIENLPRPQEEVHNSKQKTEINPKDALPIVKVAPIYPRKASSARVEGYCVVEFIVAKNGSVKNPKAVDCSPEGYFEKSSIKAASKFKYKPRIIDGKPIEVHGVQNRFTYSLD